MEFIFSPTLLSATGRCGPVYSSALFDVSSKYKRKTMSAPAEASCSIQELVLEELNVKTFEATFYNGKRLRVEYLFSHEIMGEKCLRVGVNSLSPLFGGMIPLGIHRFDYISKFRNVISIIHMNDCSQGSYDSCFCKRRIIPSEDHSDGPCPDFHWHHYCTTHVFLWVVWYLERAILLKESPEHYSHRMSEVHGPLTGADYSIGEKATAEYWLEWARTTAKLRSLAKLCDEY
ncbi:repeat element protein-d2.2 [Ichnoviriform fugitivi]|uniref:Repeat element protein-d2.2 n=1 Tax=Ichnoviriform fugitivi TaxID=265522 RepID=A2Q0J9_9VIRU|nr:repeat element protein-d2.2 [Ichnoviriform fugitivi]BAF45714.1 repeat element protein-d2.2 [Ichnoviriform fugitivi]